MATKPAWLSWGSTPRGRYEDLSMRPIGGVLADPDEAAAIEAGRDAQQPQRWTALNRPSRTRSWFIVLCFVLLIGVGMVIWSGWQPVDWTFKKYRPGGVDDGPVGGGTGAGADDGMGGGAGKAKDPNMLPTMVVPALAAATPGLEGMAPN